MTGLSEKSANSNFIQATVSFEQQLVLPKGFRLNKDSLFENIHLYISMFILSILKQNILTVEKIYGDFCPGNRILEQK